MWQTETKVKHFCKWPPWINSAWAPIALNEFLQISVWLLWHEDYPARAEFKLFLKFYFILRLTEGYGFYLISSQAFEPLRSEGLVTSLLVPLRQASCLTKVLKVKCVANSCTFFVHCACLQSCIFFLEFTASVSPVLLRGSLTDLRSESVDLIDYTDLTFNS